jgi:hypothetical protein
LDGHPGYQIVNRALFREQQLHDLQPIGVEKHLKRANIQNPIGNQRWLLEYLSPELLFSFSARRGWADPTSNRCRSHNRI